MSDDAAEIARKLALEQAIKIAENFIPTNPQSHPKDQYGWHVAGEHFAATTIRDRLRTLLSGATTP